MANRKKPCLIDNGNHWKSRTILSSFTLLFNQPWYMSEKRKKNPINRKVHPEANLNCATTPNAIEWRRQWMPTAHWLTIVAISYFKVNVLLQEHGTIYVVPNGMENDMKNKIETIHPHFISWIRFSWQGTFECARVNWIFTQTGFRLCWGRRPSAKVSIKNINKQNRGLGK